SVVAVSLFALSWRRETNRDRIGLVLILAVGATVTAYSVLDGIGVRAAGSPLGYAAWLFLLQGTLIPVLCLVLAADRRGFARALRRRAVLGSLGGAISLAAYTVVLWAQSQAPLAVVSAVRETGVLAAAVIGYLVFREPLRAWRIAATLAAVAGIVAIRVGV
ncbi:EamA family transporter, partial [Agromyces sp. NPDC060279]|uniref:EamA family transporter n=1 Tax=Agromyces sp. NPDC060279 TaxID=3347092 RepID=UPI003667C7D0